MKNLNSPFLIKLLFVCLFMTFLVKMQAQSPGISCQHLTDRKTIVAGTLNDYLPSAFWQTISHPKSAADSAVLSASATICLGSSANLTVTIAGGTPPYSITIDNGVGTITNYYSGDAIPVSPLVTTTYHLVSVIDADTNAALVLSGVPVITVVTAAPTNDPMIIAGVPYVCPTTGTNINVITENDGNTYQVMQSSTNSAIGASYIGNGGLYTVLTGPLTSDQTYYVIVSNVCGSHIGANNVTVNVIPDTTSPSLTCPTNINTTTSAGNCLTAFVFLGVPLMSDNCGIGSITNSAPTNFFPIGVTTVTWIVTDNSGNSSTCPQTVTVVDNKPPTITCPPAITTNPDPGSCYATGISLGTPVTGDNCGVASVNNNAPASFPVGVNVVVWTVTDNSGNATTCSQNVTVIDNIPPVINCPANLFISTDPATCTASGVNLGIPDTSDNCQVASAINDAPAVFPIGTTLVTWTATDLYGNTATCTQNVTVIDSIPPTITCPPMLSVSTDPGACTASGLPLGTPVTWDNCGIDTVFNDAPLSYPIGNTPVTWIIIDMYGNADTCVQQVNVIDSIPPVITCPPDLTLNTDIDGCNASGVDLGTPVSSDNCGTPIVTNNAPASFPVGVTIVTWIVTDSSGNTDTCYQNVTVIDSIPPTITCPPDMSISTDPAACSASGVNLGTPVTADNCGIGGVNNDAPAALSIGTTVVTWTVTDLYGNTATCTQNVTIIDSVPPTITCPPMVSASTDPGACTASGLPLGAPVTWDNCGIDTVFNDAPLTYPIGNTPVTWVIIDIYGNADTCVQQVNVIDSIPPVITCPPDLTLNTDIDGCNASGIDLGTPVSSDNCGTPIVTNNAPTSFPVGVTIVTWIVTDSSGNTDTCYQNVTVIDSIPPTITCPPDLTVSTDPTTCTATGVNPGTPVTADNCGIGGVNNDAPAALPLGTTVVTWTVTDLYGNTATCTQNITVIDSIPPTITCPPMVSASVDPGACTASGLSLGTPVTLDNCGIDTVFNDAPLTYPIGNTPVTWIVIDVHGNADTCVQQVNVTDSIPPVITCPPDLTLNTDIDGCNASGVDLGTPVSSDNCGVPIVTNNAPATFPVGVTIVTWIATDSSGNTDTCYQNVTVADSIPPTITCPPDLTVSTDPTTCTATGVNPGTPVTADNCGIGSVNNDAPATLPIGTTIVTWTVTDLYGNTATCTQNITVIDSIPPTITCPAPLSAYTDPGLCEASGLLLGTPVTWDNCGIDSVSNDAPLSFPIGSTPVTWIVTDIYGNADTCVQMVTVIDTVPPTIICPPDLAINADAGSCFATGVNLGMPVISDNCPGEVASNNAPASIPVGLTTVIWTVTDASGNTATCTQLVTVNGIPLAVDDYISTNQDIPVSGDVLSNDLGLCDVPVNVTGNTDPSNGSVVINPDGTFTYTPDSSFFGTDSFNYVICDLTGDCDTATVYITVIDVNYPPVVEDTNIVVFEDSTLTFCTQITDVDGAPPFTVTSNGCEEHGLASAVVVGTQVCVTYTPGPNYNGADTACFTVCDSLGACSTFEVFITVLPVNDPPLISDTSAFVYQNDTLVLCIPFTDPEMNGPFNVTIGCAQNGSATGAIAGNLLCITYIPDSGYIGTDSLCVIICDGDGLCDTAGVDITVLPRPHSFLGLTKNVTYLYQSDGSYKITFTILAGNIGNDTLRNIQINDDLSLVFPDPAEFDVIGTPLATSPWSPNLQYDGYLDIGLLDAPATLSPGQTATVTFSVRVLLNQYGLQTYSNIAIGNAKGFDSMVSDTSDWSDMIDADGDGNPNEPGENDPTSFTISIPGIDIPEGFSPNGDGINDQLVIKGIEVYPNNHLDIYNRWGNKVYEKSPYDNSWDAIPNIEKMMIGSEKVQPGTYYYVLDLHTEGMNPITGYIVIQY